MDSSAARFARIEVRPIVRPSTATTRSVEATKILVASPNRTALIALVPRRRVLLPLLVLVSHPVVAARVQLDRDVVHTLRTHVHGLGDAWRALVPDLQR